LYLEKQIIIVIVMDRIQEIELAANTQVDGLNGLNGFDKTDMFNMFIAGAKWADVNRENPWIDINEQCPEDDQLVLARVDNGRITLARAWVIETENSLSVKWTAEYIPLFGEYYITHWMPIPEFKTK